MGRQPQVTEQTRTNLREAFWDLYAERPIEKIAVREVTDCAGYNRATFYLYYHDIYEVLEEVEDLIFDGIHALVDDGLMREETLDFSQHMGLMLQLTRDYGRYTKVLFEKGEQRFVAGMKETLNPLLDRFVMSDELNAEQGHIVREFYLSGVMAAIGTWISEDDPMPINELINLVLSIVFA